MSTDNEALPPLPEALKRAYYYTELGGWHGPEVDESERWASVAEAARAALAQRQQVPEGWTIHLDTDAAETLKQTIGDDDTVSEITLSLCDGHDWRGLYVWLTEYPEKGSLLLASAPALTAAPQAAGPAVATVTECEACFTPDACRLRGTCDHYSAERLRVAAQAQPSADLRADFERECSDTDKLLAALGWKPENCRTDGGSLKLGMILEALEARDRLIRREAAQAQPQEPPRSAPLHITVLVDWLARRYRAAGGKEGITDLSAFAEDVMRWTEAQHGISTPEEPKR